MKQNLSRVDKARKQISKIQYKVLDNGCHIPANRIPNAHGYINTNFEYKQTKLHRLVAFVYLGLNLDNEMELALHKQECHNRACFNQEHIYIGNHSQNMKDSVANNTHHKSSKTHCPLGHEYDRVVRVNKNSPWRRCSQCRKVNRV